MCEFVGNLCGHLYNESTSSPVGGQSQINKSHGGPMHGDTTGNKMGEVLKLMMVYGELSINIC